MADYDWPDDLIPFAVDYHIQPHTGRAESPFTRQVKTYELTAPRWVCRMSFRGGANDTWGREAQARYGPRLDAFIAKLRGGANRAGIYDFRRDELQGDHVAADLGNLVALTGATMITATGATAGATIAKAGDYVGGDGRSHMVLEDVTADEDGQGKIRIWPPLAADIAIDGAVFGNPRSYFRLVDDDAGASLTVAGDLTTYELEFIEDLGGPDIDYPTLLPTVAAPVKAKKIELDLGRGLEELLIIRTRTSALAGSGATYFDEYWYRNPDGHSGVDNGWQLWRHWTYAKGRYFKWLTGADDLDDHPTVEFALRFGLYDPANLAPPYVAGGEGPDYAYSGFGHGRLTYVSGSIVLAGDATNYHTPGNWAVDQELSGTALTFSMLYTSLLFDGTTEAADVEMVFLLDDSGLRELGEPVDAAAGAVGWNDSYTLMAPLSHDHVDWWKPAGEDPVSIVGDSEVKDGTWGTTTTATEFQAYGNADTTIIMSVEMVHGQPIRREPPDVSIDPWELNTFGRAFFIDWADPDYPKAYVLAASSAEDPGARVAWQFTGTYQWQNRRRGRYRAGGPV